MIATARASRNSASPHLSLISQKKVSPQNAREVLAAAFEADDYADCIRNLAEWEIDPQAYVDGLDQVRPLPPMFVGVMLTAVPHQIISTLPSGSDHYYRSLRALRRTCGIHGVLPTSFKVPQGLSLITANQMKRPFASGGFSDVWKARNDKGEIFAIKHIRTYERDSIAYAKKVLLVCQSFDVSHRSPSQKYCKEVTISRRARHENVLSIEGVAPDLFQFCMVSRWMDNGNLQEYVRSEGQVDRMALVSSSALWGGFDRFSGFSSPVFS